MSKAARIAGTAGAFVVAGVAATLLNGQQRTRRRMRRGEEVEFGSVHSAPRPLAATDGVIINVEVDEADIPTPTVVFLHGWVETLDVWHYQRLALRGKVRMVFVDHRSHGRSGRSHVDNSTIWHLADDLKTVLHDVVPDGPIVLVGHSMGGMTIMELAASEPRLFGTRVVGVVLVATSSGKLIPNSPGLRRIVPLLRTASPVLEWGRAFNSYSVIRRWAVGPDAHERHVDMTNEMILQSPTHVLMDFYPNFIDLDLDDGLETLGTVTTVVIGGTADQLTPIRHSRSLATAIPGARLVAVDGAGHMVPFEAHEQVTKVIEEIVADIR